MTDQATSPRAVAGALGRFYLPPEDARPTKPGQVLRVQRIKTYVVPRVRMPARAWRILYTSTNATGQPTVASGTVLVPPKPYPGDGPRPLIGYAIGTQGLSNKSAPSHQLRVGTEYEASLIAMALRRGWALALTDYPGLGTAGNHPYVVGKALGPAVLDAMRAARGLPEAGLDKHAPLAIFGYSEGGAAAGWALQLQSTYAPDLPLVAGCVGAAPADLHRSFKDVDNGPFAFLALYGLVGLDAAYPELDLWSVLNKRGVRAAQQYNDTHIVRAILKGLRMPKDHRSYTSRSPFDDPAFVARMTENRLGAIAPQAPVLIGAGRVDQVIAYGQAETLHREWRDLGVDVHLRSMPIREHVTGGVSFGPAAFAFLARRLVGQPGDEAAAHLPAPGAEQTTSLLRPYRAVRAAEFQAALGVEADGGRRQTDSGRL